MYRTIEVNEGGFGVMHLFDNGSTKDVLYQHRSLNGYYLEELGLDNFKVGDKIEVRVPFSGMDRGTPYKGYKIYKIQVHTVTEDKYFCKFV